jgi:thymidylate kinase
MPIVALEGPDRAGKTTLFNALRGRVDAVFVPSFPSSKELLPLMPLVDSRQIMLWEALYDPSKFYICDRTPFVSGPVYDKLYGRRSVISMKLLSELHVFYLRLSAEELCRRNREDALFDNANYDRVVAFYDEEVERHRHTILDATRTTEELVQCFLRNL